MYIDTSVQHSTQIIWFGRHNKNWRNINYSKQAYWSNLYFQCLHFFYTPARQESGVYRDPHVRPSHFWFPDNNQSIAQPNLFKLSHIAVYHKIQVKFDYGVFHIYRSWVMAHFLLENRDCLDFRMDQPKFSNFNTMLWTIKYSLSSITVYFTFPVPELWPFFL